MPNTNKKYNSKKRHSSDEIDEVNDIDEYSIPIQKEILLLVIVALCILLFISNFGIGGVVGSFVSGALFGLFGIANYVIPFAIAYIAFLAITKKMNASLVIKLVFSILLIISILTFFSIIEGGRVGINPIKAFRLGMNHKAGGGFIGSLLGYSFTKGFGLAGAYILDLLLAIISMLILSGKSIFRGMRGGAKATKDAWDESNNRRIRKKKASVRKNFVEITDDPLEQRGGINSSRSDKKKRRNGSIDNKLLDEALGREASENESSESEGNVSPDDMSARNIRTINLAPNEEGSISEIEFEKNDINEPRVIEPEDNSYQESLLSQNVQSELRGAASNDISSNISSASRTVEASSISASSTSTDVQSKPKPRANVKYTFPPLNLLNRAKREAKTGTKSELEKTADKLEQTLRNFGIKAEVTDVTQGPSVTRFELLPEAGVRVNRITNLADDIKLNLAVTDIRIEAPIPGKSAVGIEVPNQDKVVVTFHELIASKEFREATSKVSFVAGRDISGSVISANIAKMPHLLIAGTTGSGKSVCINTIIMSILYKAKPDEVKFIMIDPKVVELSVYNGLPHQLIPVVTDPKKAAGALHWAVTEMDDRYNKFAYAGVRDIKTYNAKLEENEGMMPVNANGDTEYCEKMPEMVIIVDELADLMMVAAKEVEESICRLAQKARAAGMYLILATQRPSVDVVTGLIKANMPSRIAFAVNSGTDSRTIIDMYGAEKLLGNGDMLYFPQGLNKPIRVQGAFVTDDEVSRVVNYIKEKNVAADYASHVTDAIDEHSQNSTAASIESAMMASVNPPSEDSGNDTYFADAARLITSKERASIGLLQRNFKIGFNRAARIMDQLQDAGVVGPELGTKPREILMSAEQVEVMLSNESNS